MTSLSTALIFTYPEHGQANVSLATSYELALAGVNVFIASFSSLEARVLHIQQLVVRHRGAAVPNHGPSGSVRFHECKGAIPFLDAVKKHGVDSTSFRHPHGVFGALQNYSKLEISAFPWSPEEYVAVIESVKAVIAEVKPNLVVIDTLFQAAIDACQLVDQKFILIFPNSIKDMAVTLQPHLSALWKYPITSSGFSFPLKWWEIPLNVYLYTRLSARMMTSPKAKQYQALRRSLGINPNLKSRLYRGVTYICPSFPEADFPMSVIPDELGLCGPIVMPFESLEESDPGLMTWLNNGPTVMINLGSHVVCDEELAREIASALLVLLGHHDRKDIQVLWKAKASNDVRGIIDEVVGKEIKEGRIHVARWLEAEPAAILQHPNVVCTVHHGGANSYFEGIWSGIPHIVLPVWADTYEYAARVEFLNIGIFGSKTSAPGVRAEEFGGALVRVTGDGEEATGFRLAAKRLKEICRAKGNGRTLASMTILEEMGITKRGTSSCV